MEKKRDFEVIIIGSGAAGLSAGIATAYAGLTTLILEKKLIGGELAQTDKIENYPGFPDGISGFSFVKLLERQLHRFRGKVIRGEVIELSQTEDEKLIITDKEMYFSDVVIIATGTRSAKLNLTEEENFLNNGIYDSAVIYGAKYEGKNIAVYGGTERAIRETLYLCKIAEKVFWILPEKSYKIPAIYKYQIFERNNLEILTGSQIESLNGFREINSILVQDFERNEYKELEIDALFNSLERIPNTDFIKEGIELDEKGGVIVDSNFETSARGFFATGGVCSNFAGDLLSGIYEGTKAVQSVVRYFKD